MPAVDPSDDLDEVLEELPDGVRLAGEERLDVDVPAGMLPPVAVERRTLLAAALLPSMFPTTAEEVIAVLAGADLPEDLLVAVAELPDREYGNVQEIWVAIGGETEEPPGSPEAMGADEPVTEARQPAPLRPAAPGGLRRLAAAPLRLARLAATAPLAAGSATLSIGAAATQRAADGLADAATRVARR